MTSDQADFIQANTSVAQPPLTPQISLHLATELTPLWRATAESLSDSGVEPPFWAFAWPGGQALARHVLDNPQICTGQRVLDVATGSGLVAMAAAMAGAASVTANDIDPLSLAAVALNAKINSVDIVPCADDLTEQTADDRWDVILAGDIYYDRDMARRFTPWLSACAGDGLSVLVGDPGRAYLPADGFERVRSYNVPTSLDLEKTESMTGTVWRVTG